MNRIKRILSILMLTLLLFSCGKKDNRIDGNNGGSLGIGIIYYDWATDGLIK